MHITVHAYKRARERCGLKKKSLDRMLPIAMKKGLKHSETKGRLNKWVTSIYFNYPHNKYMRIYGEYLFICDKDSLITIYTVPNDLKKSAKMLLDAKKEKMK